jgi:F-type H+-transporting ATPase subunit alpha
VRPAVNVGISVSRVGGNAQIKAMKKVAGTLRIDLAQFRELAAFAQFGSDLDKATQRQLARGERLVEILKQGQYRPMPVELQVASVFAGTHGLLDKLKVEAVLPFEAFLHDHLELHHRNVLEAITSTGKLEGAVEQELAAGCKAAVDAFVRETPGVAVA